jgi:hypothetical protein
VYVEGESTRVGTGLVSCAKNGMRKYHNPSEQGMRHNKASGGVDF